MLRADPGRAIGRGSPASGVQAGHKARLARPFSRRSRGRLAGEPLPGRLLGHAHPLADLRPRAAGLPRFCYELLDDPVPGLS